MGNRQAGTISVRSGLKPFKRSIIVNQLVTITLAGKELVIGLLLLELQLVLQGFKVAT